ncbi:MAG: hypothetical protein ACFFD4_08365 [Candidatus Odinarchaeota archaeon]
MNGVIRWLKSFTSIFQDHGLVLSRSFFLIEGDVTRSHELLKVAI